MRLLVALLLIGLCVLIWASDRITLQGERTIYTVQCQGGAWEGWRCMNKLVAGDRYRFRSSKSRQEVLFWIAGSTRASGKYTDCTVKDRDNWACNVDAGQPSTVAHEMLNGRPTGIDTGLDLRFHAVRKWKWWILRAGFHVFTNADY